MTERNGKKPRHKEKVHWLVEIRKIKISSNNAWKMTICFNMSNGIHEWPQPAIKRLKKLSMEVFLNM